MDADERSLGLRSSHDFNYTIEFHANFEIAGTKFTFRKGADYASSEDWGKFTEDLRQLLVGLFKIPGVTVVTFDIYTIAIEFGPMFSERKIADSAENLIREIFDAQHNGLKML